MMEELLRKQRLEHIKNNIQKGRCLILYDEDILCTELLPLVDSIHIFDYRENVLNRIPEQPHLYKVLGSENYVGLGGTKYDTIVLVNFLEKTKSGPIRELKSIYKKLNKKGRLIIIVPNAQSFHRRLGTYNKFILYPLTKDLNSGDKRVFNLIKLVKNLNKAGIKHIYSYKTYFYKPFKMTDMDNLPKELLERCASYKTGDNGAELMAVIIKN